MWCGWTKAWVLLKDDENDSFNTPITRFLVDTKRQCVVVRTLAYFLLELLEDNGLAAGNATGGTYSMYITLHGSHGVI